MAYATVAELRALDGLGDVGVYPDATLQLGIDYATALIDGYCGTSFELKSFRVVKAAFGVTVNLGVLFVRTVASIGSIPSGSGIFPGALLVNGDGLPAVYENITAHREGVLALKVDFFNPQIQYDFQGTAGITTNAAEEIRLAARTIARQYALDLHSRMPSRALQVSNELGQFEVRAQAGGVGRPTSLPDVNVILNRNKHKPAMTGAVFT